MKTGTQLTGNQKMKFELLFFLTLCLTLQQWVRLDWLEDHQLSGGILFHLRSLVRDPVWLWILSPGIGGGDGGAVAVMGNPEDII